LVQAARFLERPRTVRAHVDAAALAALDVADFLQLAIGRGHGIGMDIEPTGERAHAGKTRPRGHGAAQNLHLELRDELVAHADARPLVENDVHVRTYRTADVISPGLWGRA